MVRGVCDILFGQMKILLFHNGLEFYSSAPNSIHGQLW